MSSSNRKSPAFQFYAHDFLAGRVATYSLEEIGAYITLLAFDWSLSGLPTRREDLARLLRVSGRKFDALWSRLAEQFEERDGRYFNPRLALEREKQVRYSEAMRQNGRKGGKPRVSRGLADGKPPESSPSPTPTPVTTKKKNPVVADAPTDGEATSESAPTFRLAPYLDVHREIRGESVPPAQKWAKSFKALERKFGAEEVLTRWRRCLTAKGEFATPQWLGQNWTDYATDAPGKPGEKTPLQELEELGAQDPWWTEGLEAARRRRAA